MNQLMFDTAENNLFQFTTLFPIILASVAASALLSPLMIFLAKKIGILDVPGSEAHKTHRNTTPLAGGMVLIVVWIGMILGAGLEWNIELAGLIVGVVLVFSFGLADDVRNLNPVVKLMGQVIAALALILTGSQVRMFARPVLDVVITLFWVVGIINAFNFVDSMDGLALGLGGIAAFFFMTVTIESAQGELAVLSAVVLGSAAGLYLFNGNPARLFLGDSGAQMLGFLLAAIGMNFSPEGDLGNLASWYVPIMVLGVPIFDMAMVVCSRLRTGERVYKAALDHIYHRLHLLGLESTRATYLLHLAGFVLGLLGFSMLYISYVFGNIVFGIIVLSAVSLIGVLEYIDGQQSNSK